MMIRILLIITAISLSAAGLMGYVNYDLYSTVSELRIENKEIRSDVANLTALNREIYKAQSQRAEIWARVSKKGIKGKELVCKTK